MQKLRFLLMSMLLMTSACLYADEVTMKYSGSTTTNMTGDNDAALFGLDDAAWSVVAEKGGNNNFPGLNKAGDLRLYWASAENGGGNKITVSSLRGATINKIAMTFTGDSYKNVSVTVGENAVQAAQDGSYAIDAESFVLGNANETNVQVRISELVITYTAGSDTRTETRVVLGDHQTKATCGKDPFVELPTATVMAGETAVEGATVVWTMNVKEWKDTEDQPELVNDKVTLPNHSYGSVELTATYAGDNTYMDSKASYTITLYKGATSLTEMWDDNEKEGMTTGYPIAYWPINVVNPEPMEFDLAEVLVTYVNGSYTYITDGEYGMLLYGSNLGLKAGDKFVIKGAETQYGIYGTLKTYRGLLELAVTDMPEVDVKSENNEVAVRTFDEDALKNLGEVYKSEEHMTLKNYSLFINSMVKVENAKFVSAEGKNLKFTVGETELVVYNQWNIDVSGLVADQTYTVTGMGSIYNTTYQICAISIEAGSETGVASVAAENDRQGAVYNMAGQRVERAVKGLYVRDGKKFVVK